jgi:hypothetical protein
MEILDITDRNPPRENQPGPQIRNPNFRINRLDLLSKKIMLMKGKKQLRDLMMFTLILWE